MGADLSPDDVTLDSKTSPRLSSTMANFHNCSARKNQMISSHDNLKTKRKLR